MSNTAQLEEGPLKTPPKIYNSLRVVRRRGGLGSLHECRQRECIDAAAAALTLTITYFLGSPKAKLSIAAARRPVFVSSLQHCGLGKFGAAELARRFYVRGGSLCLFNVLVALGQMFIDKTSINEQIFYI